MAAIDDRHLQELVSRVVPADAAAQPAVGPHLAYIIETDLRFGCIVALLCCRSSTSYQICESVQYLYF